MIKGIDIQSLKESESILAIALDIGLDLISNSTGAISNCPVCQEIGNHRHLYLYCTNNKFFCFKCHCKGDIIDLIKLVHKCNTKDAIETIKRQYGWKYGNQSPNALRVNNKAHKTQTNEMHDYSHIYESLLSNLSLSKSAFSYLHIERGLSKETLVKYNLKSIDQPSSTYGNLTSLFSVEELKQAGLVTVSADEKPYFSFYKPCIIFPHYIDGKPVYLSNRNLDNNIAKSFKLAGNHQNTYFIGNVKESSSIVIFEGIINALSYEELTGNSNFIATLGIISLDQYRKIQDRFPGKELILALDPDKAGKEATLKIQGAKYIQWDKIFKQFKAFNQIPVHDNGKEWDLNDLLIFYKDLFYEYSGRFMNDGMSQEQADMEADKLILRQSEVING